MSWPAICVRFGARYVSFLFVDVVGRRLLRVNDTAAAEPEDDRAEQVPLAGSSMYDDVLRTQKVVHVPEGTQGFRVLLRSPTEATPSACWSCSSPQ